VMVARSTRRRAIARALTLTIILTNMYLCQGFALLNKPAGMTRICLMDSSKDTTIDEEALRTPSTDTSVFDLGTCLFCAGLAFDAYVEPPENSARWEKGSRGLKVAFCSPAYTRNLYKGLIEIMPIRCTGLPDDDNTAERIMTGKGVDACKCR
jgi:hypothetical protein